MSFANNPEERLAAPLPKPERRYFGKARLNDPRLWIKDIGTPENLARRLAAYREGYRRCPKCTHVKADGMRCGRPAMREGRRLGIQLCPSHLRGDDRERVDRRREELLRGRLRTTNPYRREKAERAIAAIHKRRLLRVWMIDPTLPGETIRLTPADYEKAAAWLAGKGIDLEAPLPGVGKLATPRARSALLWTAYRTLTGRISETTAANRVRQYLRQDAAWWRRMARAEKRTREPAPPPAGVTIWTSAGEPVRIASVAAHAARPAPASMAAAEPTLVVMKPSPRHKQAAKDIAVAKLRRHDIEARIAKAGAAPPRRHDPDFVVRLNALRRMYRLDDQPEDIARQVHDLAWAVHTGAMDRGRFIRALEQVEKLLASTGPTGG